MKRRHIQFSKRHKRWFYSVSAILFLSGALWSFCDWLGNNGTQAEAFQSLKSWSLKLHGAAAMAFLVALGIIIPTHINSAWQAQRNRPNGACFIAVNILLITTGYGLYYFGGERWRQMASWIHLLFGIATPAFLIAHIWMGRRK